MHSALKKRRPFRARDICVDNTDEFCKNTTLHGLKYVVDRKLSIFERAFFGISFIVVVIIAINLISNVYEKWQNTPVIVGLNAVPTFITRSPFPAVTICNLNQALKSKANSIANDSLEDAMLQVLCNRDASQKSFSNVKDWSILESFITTISQPCERMLLGCRFGSVDYNCSELFKPVVTDEGLCCTFNMVHPAFMYLQRSKEPTNNTASNGPTPVDWNPEKGYGKQLPKNFYPRVAAGTGESLGFSVILDVELDEYYCSSSSGPGFKVSLHSPTETPHLRETGLLLQAGSETKIRIATIKSEAGNELREIRREYRQCIFNDESKLVYYTFYTKRNCEIECDAKLLIKNCDCVTYYLPKLFPNVSACGIKDLDCVQRVTRRSHLLEVDELDCHEYCLPSCYDLTFLPDFFTAPISHDGFSVRQQVIQNISNEYASKNIAVAHMYFKENTYRSSVKTQFIGITDFLSNTGGLMGLFMGFSFISLTEFIYYAFIRPFRGYLNNRANRMYPIVAAMNDNIRSRPLQTRPVLDCTSNKRHHNYYRSRLARPPISIAAINDKESPRIGTIGTNSLMQDLKNRDEAPPFPYNH